MFAVLIALGSLIDHFTLTGATEWPTAPGKIETAKVVTTTWRWKGINTGSPRWLATVEYSYAVDGKEYRGDKITLDRPTEYSEAGDAGRALKNLRPGTQVLVYYQPSDPSTAVLFPAEPGFLWLFLAPLMGWCGYKMSHG